AEKRRAELVIEPTGAGQPQGVTFDTFCKERRLLPGFVPFTGNARGATSCADAVVAYTKRSPRSGRKCVQEPRPPDRRLAVLQSGHGPIASLLHRGRRPRPPFKRCLLLYACPPRPVNGYGRSREDHKGRDQAVQGEPPRRAALGQRARAWPRLRPLPERDGAGSRAVPMPPL